MTIRPTKHASTPILGSLGGGSKSAGRHTTDDTHVTLATGNNSHPTKEKPTSTFPASGGPTSLVTSVQSTPRLSPSRGTKSAGRHSPFDIQSTRATGTNSHPTTETTTSTAHPSGGPKSVGRQILTDTRPQGAAGTNSRPTTLTAIPTLSSSGGPTSPVTIEITTPSPSTSRGTKSAGRQVPSDIQKDCATGTNSHPTGNNSHPTKEKPTSTFPASGGPTSPVTSAEATPMGRASRGTKSAGRHSPFDIQSTRATGTNSHPTTGVPTPISASSRGTKSAGRHSPFDIQSTRATGTNSHPTTAVATPTIHSSGGPTSPVTKDFATPSPSSSRGIKSAGRHNTSDTRNPGAAGTNSRPTKSHATSKGDLSGGPTSPVTKDFTTPSDPPSRGPKSVGRQILTDTRNPGAAGASSHSTIDQTTSRGDLSDEPTSPVTTGSSVAGNNSHPTIRRATSSRSSSGGPTSPVTSLSSTPIQPSSRGTKITGRHVPSNAHGTGAAGVNSHPTTVQTTPRDLPSGGNGRQISNDTHPVEPLLLDLALALSADVVDDLERVRIANENRLRQMTRTEVDVDGEERGFGLKPDDPDVQNLAALIGAMFCKSQVLKELGYPRPPKERGKPCCLECSAVANLEAKLRRHPLGAWIKAQKGVGDKQGARLLAAIGDPYIRSAYAIEENGIKKEVPAASRTPSALWAYCGLHVLPVGQTDLDTQVIIAGRDQLPDQVRRGDQTSFVGDGGDSGRGPDDTHGSTAGVAAKRRKGEKANWSGKAKSKAYLVAKSCMKQLSPQCRTVHTVTDTQTPHDGPVLRHADDCACSPYRVKYDQRRARTAVTHPEWTKGHSHNDGLRIAAKEILKHLWRAAKAWHELNTPGHHPVDTQAVHAGGIEQ